MSSAEGTPGELHPTEFRASEPAAGESWVVRAGSWVVALLLGVVFGMIGTVVNQATISVFGTATVPIGLVMACLACILLLVGLRLILPTRTLALLAAVGLVGIVAALTLQSPGGSVLIPANVYGYIWTFAPTIISLIVLAWPRRLGRRTPPDMLQAPPSATPSSGPPSHPSSPPAAEAVVPSE